MSILQGKEKHFFYSVIFRDHLNFVVSHNVVIRQLSFHPFPAEPETKSVWVAKIRWEKLSPTNGTRMCAVFIFSLEMFYEYLIKGILDHDYIPKCKLWLMS